MRTGSGKTDDGCRLSCCRARASGTGPRRQRKDQSVMGERKDETERGREGEREEEELLQGNSVLQTEGNCDDQR